MNNYLAISLMVICSFFTGLMVFVLFKFKYDLVKQELDKFKNDHENTTKENSKLQEFVITIQNEIKEKDKSIAAQSETKRELLKNIENQSKEITELKHQVKECCEKFQDLVEILAQKMKC